MLRNISIRARLMAGFGTVVLFLTVVGIMAVMKIKDEQELLTNLYNHPFTVSNALRTANTDIIRMDRGMKDIVMSTNNEELKTAVTTVNDSEKEAYESLKIVKIRYLGNKEDVDAIVRELDAWKPVRAEVIKLMLENKKERALYEYNGTAAEAVSRTERKMNDIIEFAMNKASSYYNNSLEIEAQTLRFIIILVVAAVSIAVAVSLFITSSITTPLSKAVEVADRMSIGDMTAETGDVANDETGVLLKSMDKMVGSVKEMAVIASRISKGDLMVEVNPRSDKDILGKSMQDMTIYLRNMAGVADRIAGRDLKIEMQPHSEKDILGNAFSKMAENLKEVTKEIQEAVNVLASSTSEILSTTTEVASTAAETATAVNETTTTVEEVKQTSQVSSQKAKYVSETAQKAVQVSQSGGKSVQETIDKMNRIQDQMTAVAESIIRLSEQSQAIGEIIATVNDLAEQSNLLAVNASIEAAKAGEQGRGFAVVAQEVKSLAEQSKQATSQVRVILGDIQKATGAAVLATEQGGKSVEAGVLQSAQAGEAIRMLAGSISEAAQAATQIAASSQQQVVGMEQIITAMDNIRQASEQNVSGTRQTETAAQNLHELGQKLKGLVERFKV